MAYNNTFDTTTPASTDSPTGGDDRIREIKLAIQERLNGDMYFALAGSEVSDDTKVGKHNRVTFLVQAGDPTLLSDELAIYTKEVETKSELFFKDEDGTVTQITTGGVLNIVGTYALEVAFTNTDNQFFSDDLQMKAGGRLLLPTDTTDTTEGNLHYKTDTDVLQYRDASAWIELAQAAKAAKIKVGKYSGDGTATQSITGVGFQPAAVMVLPDISGQYAFCRTADMSGTEAKNLGGTGTQSDSIRSLDADGFTVGDGSGDTNHNMNKSGTNNYMYIALKASS